jgi:hypothetical protein
MSAGNVGLIAEQLIKINKFHRYFGRSDCKDLALLAMPSGLSWRSSSFLLPYDLWDLK